VRLRGAIDFRYHGTNIDLVLLLKLIKALKPSLKVVPKFINIIISLVSGCILKFATLGGTSDYIGDTD
jgi:hypothetical protein